MRKAGPRTLKIRAWQLPGTEKNCPNFPKKKGKKQIGNRSAFILLTAVNFRYQMFRPVAHASQTRMERTVYVINIPDHIRTAYCGQTYPSFTSRCLPVHGFVHLCCVCIFLRSCARLCQHFGESRDSFREFCYEGWNFIGRNIC